MRYFLLLFAFAVATVMVVAGKRGDFGWRSSPAICVRPGTKVKNS